MASALLPVADVSVPMAQAHVNVQGAVAKDDKLVALEFTLEPVMACGCSGMQSHLVQHVSGVVLFAADLP